MVLLPWDEDKKRREEEQQGQLTPANSIQSVQNTWQPTQVNTPSGNSSGRNPAFGGGDYLFSDEKAQRDARVRAREAEEARVAAINAENARRAEAAKQMQAQAQPTEDDLLKKAEANTGWEKYYDEEFEKSKKGQNFFSRLIDGGQASRRAEVNARNRYSSELLARAYDDKGNMLDRGAAEEAALMSQYASGKASQAAERSRAISNSIGANRANNDNILLRARDSVNALRQASLHDATFGANDETRFDGNDIGKFLFDLLPQIAAAPATGLKSGVEATTGTGTDMSTGLDRELTGLERGGRAVSGVLDATSPFIGGSGRFLTSLMERVAANTATQAERKLLSEFTKKVIMPATEQGALGAGQGGAEYFAQGGELVDENGNFDINKLGDLFQQMAIGGGLGVAGGAVLGGAGAGVTKMKQAQANKLTPEVTPVKLPDNQTPPATPARVADGVVEQPGSRQTSPEPADGVVRPETTIDEVLDPNTPQRVTPEQTRQLQDARAGASQAEEAVINQRLQQIENETPRRAVDIAEKLPPGTYAREKVRLYRGNNDTNKAQASPDRAVYHADTPEYAKTYGDDVTTKNAEGGVFTANGIHAYDELTKQLRTALAKRIDTEAYKKLTGNEKAELDSWLNHTLEGERLSRQFNRPMPEAIKQAFDDLGVDYIRIPGDQFKGTVGKVGHQTEIIELPKPKQQTADGVVEQPGSRQTSPEPADGVVRPETTIDEVLDPNTPQRVTPEQTRQLQESRAGASQAEEAVINQALQEANTTRPSVRASKSDLPDGMGDATPVKTPKVENIKNNQVDRLFSGNEASSEVKSRLARALNMAEDTESSLADILSNTDVKMSSRTKEAIRTKHETLERHSSRLSQIMKQQGESYKVRGTEGLDAKLAREANSLQRKIGTLESDLNSYARRFEGRQSLGNRAANTVENLVGARNTNILTSAPLVERNLLQDVGASMLDALVHPVKAVKNSANYPRELVSSIKASGERWKVKPKTISETLPYMIGNTYNSLMTPVTAVANTRKAQYRKDLAEAFLRMQGNDAPTAKQIKSLAGSMGSSSEVVANNLAGVLNGMTNHKQGMDVMKAWQRFIKDGSAADKAAFMQASERATSLASKMSRQAIKDSRPSVRIAASMLNLVMPFINTASNLARTTARYNFSPVAKNISDEVLASVRSKPQNIAATMKSAAARYGVLGTAFAMAQAGAIGYNDGDDASKPQGVYIDLGNDKYITARATPLELPLAVITVASEIAKDAGDSDRELAPGKYWDILANSLPYVSSTDQVGAAVESGTALLRGDTRQGTDDDGYAAKAYGMSMVKSFVPFSNNGLLPFVDGKQGKSTTAKSTYDKDTGAWFANNMKNSFNIDRDSLKDSRDAAGRVRTVDSQGAISHKTINDPDTKKHNQNVVTALDIARRAKIGDGTQEMFNSFDNGKNNHFNSIQSGIWAMTGGEGNETKLQNKKELADLSKQIESGFFGDGDDLLTLNGDNLWSDVSAPNSRGSKNSSKPINMRAIRQAIAAVGLPEDQREALNALGQEASSLYDRAKSGEISWDERKSIMAQIAQQEARILGNSESYQKMQSFMGELRDSGFFEADGLGSTRSGQTYLWNSLNALLSSKGKTPAAEYPKEYGSGGGGRRSRTTVKGGAKGTEGIKWTPVKARQMAKTQSRKLTPFKVNVKLGSAVGKDKTQDYRARNF